jgi:hypothetical protein
MVKVAKVRSQVKKATSAVIRHEETGISLSTELSEPITDLMGFSMLIFGRPKIGKTTLAAQFEGIHHFMFERGAEALKIHQKYVKDWPSWKEYLKLLTDQSQFGTISVDVIERAWDRCEEWWLQDLGLDALPDDYGKTVGKIRKDFMQAMLAPKEAIGLGAIYLSHAKESDRTTAEGNKVKDIHANLSGKTLEEFVGAMDIVGYYTYERDQRVLQLVGDDFVHCGHRLENHFNTTKGDPIKYLPLGSSAKEGYDNLLRAFDNDIKPEEIDFTRKKKES